MLLIEVKLLQEAFLLLQKNEIGGKLTDVPSSIEAEDMCTLGWTDVEEIPSEDWELGGLSMTTEAIRALIAGE
jgi:4-oxalocrotonate tautomerase